MSLNTDAKEYVPKWLNKSKTSAATATAATATAAPSPSPPSTSTTTTKTTPTPKPYAQAVKHRDPTGVPAPPNEGFKADNTTATAPSLGDTGAPRKLAADSKWNRPIQQQQPATTQTQHHQASSRAEGAASRSPPSVLRGTKPPLPSPEPGRAPTDEFGVDTPRTAASSESSTAPPLRTHSAEEALEISRKSTLKASATIYLPTRRVVIPQHQQQQQQHQQSVSPPPRAPVPTERAAASKPGIQGGLNDTWNLYYIERRESAAHGGTQKFDPYLVYTFDDITTFWRVFNNIPTATLSPQGCTFFLFREGIEPRWEDEANKDGGAETIKFNAAHTSEKIDRVWLRCCACAVGESWSNDTASKVNGVVLKHRNRNFTLQVWTRERVQTMPTEIRQITQDPATFSEYLSHKTMAEHAANAEAAAAAAGYGSKNNKNKDKRK